MIIRKLQLRNFGKFQNKEILLKEGINIIYGENESGKSTIHSFLQSMFSVSGGCGEKRLKQILIANIHHGNKLAGMRVP